MKDKIKILFEFISMYRPILLYIVYSWKYSCVFLMIKLKGNRKRIVCILFSLWTEVIRSYTWNIFLWKSKSESEKFEAMEKLHPKRILEKMVHSIIDCRGYPEL